MPFLLGEVAYATASVWFPTLEEAKPPGERLIIARTDGKWKGGRGIAD